MPGALTFGTTADGAASPTERMRIASNGYIGINNSTPSESLHVSGNIINSTSVGGTGDKGIMLGNGHRLGLDQSGTRSWTFKPTNGQLQLNSGDGAGSFRVPRIAFGGDSADANCLDDYEEGSWSASNLNYDYDGNQAQRGHYIKIGRIVHAFFRIKFHNQSTYTGQHLRFTGLPFTAASGNPYDINVGGIAHGYGQVDFFRIYVQPNSTYAYWYTETGNNYNNSTSLNSKDIRGCITYTAAS